jgi:hypothetical protein
MYANSTQAQDLVDRLQDYGVRCDGEVVTSEYHDQVSYDNLMTLAEVAEHGGRITRVRLLTESWAGTRMADISYIHATLADGTIVPVRHDEAGSGPLWGPKGMKSQFIEWAKSQGVYAKGLGLLDESNWSVLY